MAQDLTHARRASVVSPVHSSALPFTPILPPPASQVPPIHREASSREGIADAQAGQTYIEGRFTNKGGGKFTTILTTLLPGETAPNWKPTDTPTQTAREPPAGT